MNPENVALKDFVLDQLIDLRNISVKAMFGGYSLYNNKKIFALITDGKLYGKANQGTLQFTYSAKGKTMTMKYWEVPEELLEDRAALTNWAMKCIAVNAS